MSQDRAGLIVVSEPSVTAMTDPLAWYLIDGAPCKGQTNIFFAPQGERPEAREVREQKARNICRGCPVLIACRTWAREQREYGFWGGESEEERAAAGYRVEMPVGRIARYPRGEGMPVTPRPSARSQIARAIPS